MFCAVCEKYVDVTTHSKKEVYKVRGETIEVDAQVSHCKECGLDVFDEELDSITLNKAYDIYRERHGLLHPDRIRSLRENYGLSQRALSLLLGWGEITLHRYESGAIQDKAHDTTLRLLESPESMRRLLESNRSRLPTTIATRFSKRMEQLLQEENERAFQVSFERLLSHNRVDITSGFRGLDLEKFKGMALYLIKKCDGLLKTQLNKLTWYSDFLHFKENSVSISGTQYVCLPFGPAPNNYEMIIGSMIHEGLIDRTEIIFDSTSDIRGDRFTALANPPVSLFTNEELKAMDTVTSAFREYGSKAIADKSHQEVAYKKSKEGDIISYEYAVELSLSVS